MSLPELCDILLGLLSLLGWKFGVSVRCFSGPLLAPVKRHRSCHSPHITPGSWALHSLALCGLEQVEYYSDIASCQCLKYQSCKCCIDPRWCNLQVWYLLLLKWRIIVAQHAWSVIPKPHIRIRTVCLYFGRVDLLGTYVVLANRFQLLCTYPYVWLTCADEPLCR